MSVYDEDDSSDGLNETPGLMPRSVSLVVDSGTPNEISSECTNTTSSRTNLTINEELQHECDTNFVNVKIDDNEWRRRIQDGGCAQSELPKKRT